MIRSKLKDDLLRLATDMRKIDKISDDSYSTQLANIIADAIKTAVSTVVASGVPVPQDGGTAIQTAMKATSQSI